MNGRVFGIGQLPGRRDGMALGAAIIMLVVILVLGLAYLTVAVHEWILVRKEVDNARAFFLAEAGRQRALYDLNVNPAVLPSYSDEPLDGGSYSVQTSGDPSTGVTVTSTGVFNDMQRQVQSTVVVQ